MKLEAILGRDTKTFGIGRRCCQIFHAFEDCFGKLEEHDLDIFILTRSLAPLPIPRRWDACLPFGVSQGLYRFSAPPSMVAPVVFPRQHPTRPCYHLSGTTRLLSPPQISILWRGWQMPFLPRPPPPLLLLLLPSLFIPVVACLACGLEPNQILTRNASSTSPLAGSPSQVVECLQH